MINFHNSGNGVSASRFFLDNIEHFELLKVILAHKTKGNILTVSNFSLYFPEVWSLLKAQLAQSPGFVSCSTVVIAQCSRCNGGHFEI